MLDRIAATSLAETRKRLYAHYDYFGYLIPGSWILLGLAINELCLANASPLRTTAAAGFNNVKGALMVDSTALEIAAAIAGLVLAFNIIYVVGHLANGLSSLFIDRWIVKKILKYPTYIYFRKLEDDAEHTDHQLFSQATQDSSYRVLWMNLLPWTLVIIGLALHEWRFPDHTGLVRALWDDQILTFLIVASASWAFFGRPRTGRPCRLDLTGEWSSRPFTKERNIHFAVQTILIIAVWRLVSFYDTVLPLLAFPGLSFLIAYVDRAARNAQGDYRSTSVKRAFHYLRAVFPNWLYFLALQVDYGSMPSKSVISRARKASRSQNAPASDFFWLSFLRLENILPASYPAAYHFLSMYGMNRNLCGASVLVGLHAVSLVLFGRAIDESIVAFWALLLLVAAVGFYMRYLYLFSAYYTKYVVRSAAFSLHI